MVAKTKSPSEKWSQDEMDNANASADYAESQGKPFLPSEAGAGRGKQGGPTAKELNKAQEKSAPAKFRKGGSVRSASQRADGIAQRGKTRGKIF